MRWFLQFCYNHYVLLFVLVWSCWVLSCCGRIPCIEEHGR